ncbi:MAG TPA: hypothetical protein GX525_07810 [Bacilli bacterium]|nr:hypothetical protein [Bacilli bacterium]
MFVLHLFILLVSLIELIAIGWVKRIYLYFPRTALYAPILLMIFFAAAFSMSEGSRLRNNKTLFIMSLLLLMLIPLFFYKTIPTYTFEEAELLIQKQEKIELIDDPRTTIYSEKLRLSHYVITGINNGGEKVAFMFDPFTGEFVEIEADI